VETQLNNKSLIKSNRSKMKKFIFLLAAAGSFLSAQAQQPTNPNQPMHSTPNQSNQPNQSTQPNQREQSQDRSQGVIQDRDVPSSVMSAFNSAYPNTSGVKWKRDGSNYKAMYETSGMDQVVVYDASGNLVKTKSEIETSQLPSKAMEYVSANYNRDTVKEAFRVTDASGIMTYKAEVRGMYLIFDNNGNFVRSEKKDANQSRKDL
jgi:hypothetical protein